MTSTSIYQEPVLSYVYRLDHPTTGKFYFGFRKANIVPANQDLGVDYFTSSEYVEPRFQEFNYTIIQEFVDPLEAYDLEQFLIYQELKNPLMLNIRCYYGSKSRFTFTGKKHSKESKDKISASGTGKKHSQETKDKISASGTGKKHSQETKDKISASGTGKKHSKESKDKISAATKGVHKSEETKRKMRKPKSEEHKKNLSLATKGLAKSDEHKKNLSLATTGRILSEETKRKMSNTRKGAIRGHMRIVECPHCFLSGGVANMKRWHFDNCKFNNMNNTIVNLVNDSLILLNILFEAI